MSSTNSTSGLGQELPTISASVDGGPRSRVCTHETLPSAPHRHYQTFSGTCVCRVTFKHLPQPLRSHIQSFGTLGQLLKFSKVSLSRQIRQLKTFFNPAILSTFRFFHFCLKKNKKLWSLCLPCIFENSGHFVCLPSP